MKVIQINGVQMLAAAIMVLVLTGCHHIGEHPSGDHPTMEHPAREHPGAEHPAP
jgi:hypothetical protein